MTDAAPDTGTDATDTSTDATDTDAPDIETVDDSKVLRDTARHWKNETDKFKALARKHEDRAKANADAAKKLTELERQNMTEMEAAVDKAKVDTRAEVLGQFGAKLATEAVRAAAAGRVADVDALLEGLDAAKFLGADGDPDRDAISAWVDRIAPKAEDEQRTTFLDLGQGARGTTPSTNDPLQKALEDLSRR